MRATLLCWNVAGRVRQVPDQLDRVRERAPDVVCLQEITARTSPLWREGLLRGGWEHIAMASAQPAREAGRSRPLSVLTAARAPLEAVAVESLPWAERVLATCLDGLEVVNVHSPISQRPGLVKVLTHAAVSAHLARGNGPRLVCGDLNTPRREHADGTVWTFARTRSGRLRPERGARWDEAELALLKGLESHGFRDAFRARHGYDVRELSWEWPRTGGGYRLDHLIASAEVEAQEVGYLHEWRRDGLSDHSPLVATVAW